MTTNTQNRTHLFGLPIDKLTLEETAQRAREMARSGHAHQHVVVNAAKVVAASANSALADAIASCHIVNADGMSIVWAGRALGNRLPERVAGIDLMIRLLEIAADDGDSVFLLGAKRTVVQTLADRIVADYPGIRIAGVVDGYWSDDAEVVRQINIAKPNYLFLGIPSPQKEFWLQRWLPELSAGFAMGVGGSFDVLAGVRTRAPRWTQRAGLEWTWRLLQEPRRMWRRYLQGNSRFLYMLARELLRRHDRG